MNSRDSQKILKKAADICIQSGNKLTDKRLHILKILVESESLLSAYEIVDRYNLGASKSMPPMSAYRILDFLVSEHLVHKLSSENKYIACAHITCCPNHEVRQFLICQKCHRVKEITIPSEIIDGLKKRVTKAKFQLINSQLELDCVCDDCFNK